MPSSHHLINKPKFDIEAGIPPDEFFTLAWADEPLTSKQVLIDTDIIHALPTPVPERSLVAKLDGRVIAQCSLYDTATYWNHVNRLDTSSSNESTQTFVAIHRLTTKLEKEYLDMIGEDIQQSEHNAGIAVLPESRGHGIGKLLTAEQIKQSKARGKTTFFCQTTNIHSAKIMEQLKFRLIAAYAYRDLAKVTGNSNLNNLDDSLSVWCKSMK
jgi:ribosomal protein S18 acetylase RimI-like enzyme